MQVLPQEPELLTTREMAEADRLAVASGTTGEALMQRAGEAVARACISRLSGGSRRRIAVFCGPGNNGGDGYVAAAALRAAGHDITVAGLGDAAALSGDAAKAARQWGAPVATLDSVEWGAADLLVDALFGAGLARPVAGEAASLIDAMNRSGKPIVAVDVPSGVHGDSGQAMGTAVRAAETVTFFRLKPGHILLPGRSLCGRITLADIGIAAEVLDHIRPRTLLNTQAIWRAAYPVPSIEGHKYSRGHALVVSGGMPTTGAARLAARAALRIGAGLVTLASPPDALAAHAAQLTAIMLRESPGSAGLRELLSDARKNVVVLGPGLGVGAATRELVEIALTRPAAGGQGIVLDADALTSFAGDTGSLGRLIAGFQGSVVVTPHDGEFARLFEGEPDEFRAPSKLVRARAGARKLGAILVLKGADSVVAHPDGRASIAASDAPWLATAGSGDVLSGMVGGLLAQHMPAFEAASAAVHLHVAAAMKFGPGLISEDLPEMLPAVLRDLLG